MDLSDTPIVFLDIDGVIQPFYNNQHYSVDWNEFQVEMAKKYDDPGFLIVREKDLAASALAWDKTAICNIKTLLRETGAKIVMTSGWCDLLSLEDMKHLFRIHDLDSEVIGHKRLFAESCYHKNNYIAFEDYASKHMYDTLQRYEIRQLKFQKYSSWQEFMEEDRYAEGTVPNNPYFNQYFIGKMLETRKPDYRYISREYRDQLVRESQEIEQVPLSAREERIHERVSEILVYVAEHNVQNYIAIDDIDMSAGLGERAITIGRDDEYFKSSHLEKAISVLKNNRSNLKFSLPDSEMCGSHGKTLEEIRADIRRELNRG